MRICVRVSGRIRRGGQPADAIKAPQAKAARHGAIRQSTPYRLLASLFEVLAAALPLSASCLVPVPVRVLPKTDAPSRPGNVLNPAKAR